MSSSIVSHPPTLGAIPGVDAISKAFNNAIQGIFDTITDAVLGAIADFIGGVMSAMLGTPHAPNPEDMFINPSTEPWASLYDIYVQEMLPIGFLLLSIIVGASYFAASFTPYMSNYEMSRLHTRIVFVLIGWTIWWPIANLSLYLVDGVVGAIIGDAVDTLANSFAASITSLGGGIIMAVLGSGASLTFLIGMAAVYIGRKIALIALLELVPILFPLWVANIGPLKQLSQQAESIMKMFVPFAVMTIPTAVLFKVAVAVMGSLSTGPAIFFSLAMMALSIVIPVKMFSEASALKAQGASAAGMASGAASSAMTLKNELGSKENSPEETQEETVEEGAEDAGAVSGEVDEETGAPADADPNPGPTTDATFDTDEGVTGSDPTTRQKAKGRGRQAKERIQSAYEDMGGNKTDYSESSKNKFDAGRAANRVNMARNLAAAGVHGAVSSGKTAADGAQRLAEWATGDELDEESEGSERGPFSEPETGDEMIDTVVGNDNLRSEDKAYLLDDGNTQTFTEDGAVEEKEYEDVGVGSVEDNTDYAQMLAQEEEGNRWDRMMDTAESMYGSSDLATMVDKREDIEDTMESDFEFDNEAEETGPKPGVPDAK